MLKGGAAGATKGAAGGGSRAPNAVNFNIEPSLEEEGGGGIHSDVDEETAIDLLAKTQECSKYFCDFSPQELVTLARTLTVLHFQVEDTVLYQGEPATFFAVVLEGQV